MGGRWWRSGVEDDSYTTAKKYVPYWPKEERALFEQQKSGGRLKKALKEAAVELSKSGEGPLADEGNEFSETIILVWNRGE